jgi:hypothetical protein
MWFVGSLEVAPCDDVGGVDEEAFESAYRWFGEWDFSGSDEGRADGEG